MIHPAPRSIASALAVLLFVPLAGSAARAAPAAGSGRETRLLRYPDIHGDRVVFCYAGDLWLADVARDGDLSLAMRLTTHPGLELFPRFSPDGRWIAFTGQYDGDEQVYAMPVDGGSPRQLTFYPARGPLPSRWGYDHQVYGWSPDGSAVLFRSLRDGWSLTDSRLYLVALEGGLPEPLALPVSGAGDLSPDGRRVVYSPLIRDFRTWKRYEGGWAQDLWIFDRDERTAVQLTEHPRTERDPMWIGDTIYYASDATGTLNLYAVDVESRATRQITQSDTWDVRWPAADPGGRIVYEKRGRLHVLDTGSGEDRALRIRVPDDGVARRPVRVSAEEHIEHAGLAPGGRRALFSARGEVFTVPVEHGPVRNLTRSPGAHEKWSAWSPDGRKVAWISDASGEEELWMASPDGLSEPERLTRGLRGMLYRPRWSPDSRRIAFSDLDGRVRVLDVDSGELTTVADDPAGRVRDHAWSPDGRFLAFSLGDPNGFSSLWIWSLEEERLRRITSPQFDESGPAWSPDGRYLFYLSDRQFAPQLGSIEWNYVTDRETGVFALALREDVPHPFPPRSDEVEPREVDTGDDETQDDETEEQDPADESDPGDEEGTDEEEPAPAGEAEDGVPEGEPVRIDFAGLDRRVTRVPVPADNYRHLEAVEGRLLWLRATASYYGREPDRDPRLEAFSFEDREATSLAEDVRGYALAPDGAHVLVRKETTWEVLEPGASDEEPKPLELDLEARKVPAEEWQQIFDEVWRRFRDFFYVENLHGYDWPVLRARYRSLLDHVAHRSDLNYVIGEMIAELEVSHAYIAGGDWKQPERPEVGLLGARFELDPASGRYRIARIFEGHNEEERYRSPLTEVGVDVEEGDYLLAVEGEALRAPENPYRLLQHRAGHAIRLTVNDRPGTEGAREVRVLPVTSENDLVYLGWVLENRRRVARATDGRVGYLHLPDMGANGIREFIKWYYGQIRKEGLIVDVRNNGGGNVSQMIIERLRRSLLGTNFSRHNDFPGTYPAMTFHGHMACVLDETSASDGDIFAHMFRKAGLGPIVGKRSWGGVIGITNRGSLMDGGQVYVPEFGTNDVDGSWILEGHGVEPDIEVEQDPAAVIEGRDPQLDRAVEEVLERIEEEPRRLPEPPRAPVRTD